MIRQISLDAGQTGIKIRIAGETVVDDIRPGVRTDRPVLPQIAAVVWELEDRHGTARTVTAGISGLTPAESDAGALAALLPIGPRRIVLAHDSITSYLGAVGAAHGAVVASGTGVVTLGVGERGVARVDGWGNVMGDVGSGFWIGRAALEAVMRAVDGRGSATALREVVAARWPDLPGAYVQLQSDPGWVKIVASFARPVAELASTDAVAGGIARRAAGELAASVLTALRRTQPAIAHSAVVAAVGGVFGSPVIRAEFSRVIGEAGTGARIIAATGDGLDGAQRLADIPDGHPLAERLFTIDTAHELRSIA